MRGYGGAVALLVLSAACTALRTEPVSRATPGEAIAAADEGGALPEPSALSTTPLEEEDVLAVRDVRVERAGSGRRVHVTLSRTPEGYRHFVLQNPPRVVIDLNGPLPPTPTGQRSVPLGDDLVARARSASNGSALRVVLDLNDVAPAHAIRREGRVIVAELGDTALADAPAPVPAAEEEPARVVLAAAVVPEPAPEPVVVAAADVGKDEPAPVAVSDAATKGVRLGPPPVADPPPAPVVVAQADPAPAAAPPPVPVRVDPPAEEPVRVAKRTPPPPPDPLFYDRPVFTGQRVSLDFKDADVQNVLRVLADVSGLNIIATDDVKGKVTLHLTDVPWDQALDLILRSNRLEMSREGNVVRISTVARLKEEREALRAAQDAERELEPLRVKYIRVNYARADESLIEKVKGVLTDRGSVTFDERTNTIIVRDIPRGIQDALELIRQLDVQSPQVLIEANLVEATEDFARGLGVQWGYGYQAGPGTGNPTGFNFPGTVGLGGSGLGAGTPAPPSAGVPKLPVPFLADFPVPSGFGSGFGPGTGSALDLALGSLDGTHSLSARLTALEELGKGKVISRPRVITMNNVAATIQSLTIIRVKLPSTGTVINTGTGGAAGSASAATEKINTGITLVVTPQISADGFVLMNIYAKSSQPDFSRNVDGIPSEVSREANSNVLIQDGETVVLGGIFRNTADDRESGLPYLRRVPALGWLFKRLLRTNHREELLVFLTPKIVTSGTAALPSAERLWEERRQGG
jgi:type IV pilus secretin PilQ/predicted competence protein